MLQSRFAESKTPGERAENGASRLTLADLAATLTAVDPAAMLVLPRILRRVIKQHCSVVRFGLRVPHRKSFVIDRDSLLAIVDKRELGLADDAPLPQRVILLGCPRPQRLATRPADELLTYYWRLLFHSRVHAVLEERLATGELAPAVVRRRIHEIGETQFDEIRLVLGQENLLLPPHSDESVYVEFAATYLELKHFAAGSLARYFPGITDTGVVDETLRQDVDGPELFEATRPAGTPDPVDIGEIDEWIGLSSSRHFPSNHLPPAEIPSETKYRVLMRKSQRPAAQGNLVRAAIYRAWAERCAPPEMVDRVRVAIKLDISRFIRRLQDALELEQSSPQDWQESLFALVNQTPRGIWTVEARLLYDLQKICVDHEREIYTVDLVEWATSWGRRPIKRLLPNQRDVLMLKHLRSALRRVAVARISDEQRRQLASLLHEAMGRVEVRLRERLRPIINDALDEVRLIPQNLPERVARKKLVEEILDEISERGHVSMGDLRDAFSRNNLKLPDITGPREFLHGDALLRADRKLSTALDGVYHRGEIYLRWMQRASSLGFGTRIGRAFTRFVAVPYGGAFVTLSFMHHVWELIAKHKQSEGFQFTSPSVLLLGTVLLCLVNSVRFRGMIANLCSASFQVFRVMVIQPMRWVIETPLVQLVLKGRLFTLLVRFLLKPLIVTVIIGWFVPFGENSWWTALGGNLSIFLAVNLVLNSRLGRTVEEAAADWVVQGWHRFGIRLITGLFWFIVDLFNSLVQTVERLMYTVDEWLRFKSGEGRSTFVSKAILGLIWFFVAYIVRFAVNVLIEPQINPIKHFPVVTVGHKLLLPLYKPFADLLEVSMGFSKLSAWSVSTTVIWCTPGIFGFLVWELKENWRLYAANRRRDLNPVRIGSHGETMARLFRPGFHSGTVPKRYAKLRRAERHASADGDWSSVHKQLQTLHHVALALRRYVEREFVELIAQSNCWQLLPIRLEQVRLSTNSAIFSLRCDSFTGKPLEIVVASQAGWLLAGVKELGWVKELLPQQRQVLITALLGLYKYSGVNLVRQQIDSEFGCPLPAYDVSVEGLRVWPDEEFGVEVVYDFQQAKWIAPQTVRGLPRRRLPTVERDRLLFSEVPIAWVRWVEAWNQDVAGRGHPRESVAPICVLPS